MVSNSQFEYKPFTFRDFDAPNEGKGEFVSAFGGQEQEVQEPVEPEAPAAPTFSEEDLQRVREEALREGVEQGKAEAEAAFDRVAQAQQQSLSLLLSDLLSRMDVEADAIKEAQAQQRKDVGALVLLLTKKLVGNAMTSQPLGVVEPTIAECMALLQGKSHIVIAVEPGLAEPLRAYVAKHAREGQAIEVIADDALSAGDCRIQWPGGKAERNHGALWREVEAIMARTMGMSPLDMAREGEINQQSVDDN